MKPAASPMRINRWPTKRLVQVGKVAGGLDTRRPILHLCMRSTMGGLDWTVRLKISPAESLAAANSSWSITQPTLTFSLEMGISQNHLFSRRTMTVSPPLSPASTLTPVKWPKTASFFRLRMHDAQTFLIAGQVAASAGIEQEGAAKGLDFGRRRRGLQRLPRRRRVV